MRNKQKPGPKPGSANEGTSVFWYNLLGDYAEELVKQAHEEAEIIRQMDETTRRRCFATIV